MITRVLTVIVSTVSSNTLVTFYYHHESLSHSFFFSPYTGRAPQYHSREEHVLAVLASPNVDKVCNSAGMQKNFERPSATHLDTDRMQGEVQVTPGADMDALMNYTYIQAGLFP